MAPGRRVVQILVAADARVDPVADVDARHRDRPRCPTGRNSVSTALVTLSPPPTKSEPAYFCSLLEVRKIFAVEREARAGRPRLVGEDLVAAGVGGQERAVQRGAERAVLVEHVAGRRAAAVDVARRRHARIVLAPLRGRRRLARPAIGLPGALAVVRREAEVGVLHHPADAAGRRIVVVVLEDVAERGDRLLVAVAVVVADDLGVGAVRVHADGEAADVDVAVVARLAGELVWSCGILNGPTGPSR